MLHCKYRGHAYPAGLSLLSWISMAVTGTMSPFPRQPRKCWLCLFWLTTISSRRNHRISGFLLKGISFPFLIPRWQPDVGECLNVQAEGNCVKLPVRQKAWPQPLLALTEASGSQGWHGKVTCFLVLNAVLQLCYTVALSPAMAVSWWAHQLTPQQVVGSPWHTDMLETQRTHTTLHTTNQWCCLNSTIFFFSVAPDTSDTMVTQRSLKDLKTPRKRGASLDILDLKYFFLGCFCLPLHLVYWLWWKTSWFTCAP